jgi:hypothetical protein
MSPKNEYADLSNTENEELHADNGIDFKISEVKFMVVGVSACKYIQPGSYDASLFCHMLRTERDIDYFRVSVTSTPSCAEKEGEFLLSAAFCLAPYSDDQQIRENLGIVAGQELPRRGRCKHYGKSYRWFRFSCCAKVFPCDKYVLCTLNSYCLPY